MNPGICRSITYLGYMWLHMSMAHAGGFLSGMILATLLVILKVAKCDDTGQSLLRIIRPSLYQAVLYESPKLSPEAVLISKTRPGINTHISFELDTEKSGKQAQHGKKRVLG